MLKTKHFTRWKKREHRKKVTIAGAVRTEQRTISNLSEDMKKEKGGGKREKKKTVKTRQGRENKNRTKYGEGTKI